MRFLIFLLPLLLWSEENLDSNESQSFITEYEYGEMLYQNPRGVSCQECHGDSGEGKTIVHYEDIHSKEDIKGADIRKKTLAQMITSVGSYHKVMPRYYLTDVEVKAIYEFIQKKNKVYLDSTD
jgi:mono/diheme cytochrome c family protein